MFCGKKYKQKVKVTKLLRAHLSTRCMVFIRGWARGGLRYMKGAKMFDA